MNKCKAYLCACLILIEKVCKRSVKLCYSTHTSGHFHFVVTDLIGFIPSSPGFAYYALCICLEACWNLADGSLDLISFYFL